MRARHLSLFVIGCVALGLLGCDALDGRVSNASEIVKKGLLSPSSFSLVSGREVWSGKDKDGNPAHIVRIEYDASNAFGAKLRDCKLVAYIDKGSKIQWKTEWAVQPLDVGGPDEAASIEITRVWNFSK